MSHVSPILVIGAGAWGTALAVHLARNGQSVNLWGHRPSFMRQLSEYRSNQRYLPNINFPDTLNVFEDMAPALNQVQDILIVVPSVAFVSIIQQLKQFSGYSYRIAWATKGLDPSTARPLSESIAALVGSKTSMAIISGPSFAAEVGQALPTAISIAGNDDEFIESMVERLHAPHFRVYPNDDFLGVQLCGVMKNILAIAMGICVGLGLGANTRAALLTRGIAEMRRLLLALGGAESTLLGLAGMGDLVLTCSDDQSRNRRFGYGIGCGVSIDDAQASVGGEVEGLSNTRQLLQLADSYAIELPITQQVHEILFQGVSPRQGLENLLNRQRASTES